MGKQVKQAAKDMKNKTAALTTIMPNTRGPTWLTWQLLCSVAHSVGLYGALLWAKAMHTERLQRNPYKKESHIKIVFNKEDVRHALEAIKNGMSQKQPNSGRKGSPQRMDDLLPSYRIITKNRSPQAAVEDFLDNNPPVCE
ncbi:hypothetical protein HHI36_006891 [Cryptolaemus montrouzieri]|uniref:Uncharacterized protein n=1 Tax=Cryptolaemus montrouzieri TaxID=559131 RepID=A0ABD2MN49_9CUCU